ncbi:hypothetical protein [Rhodoblastus sp.]|jgi:hypothetical protein|uniref:hypothetical protein n=1 Tax=Rhodoblastus sp. TaxID=1962975 RepID=UPI0025E5AA32|nr:hypothetical protein [Rhodoblastus sp.]
MNIYARHKLYGHTLAEHIQTISDELPVDAVGLWQIVPAGRYGFGLEGAELSDFIRLCVLALLAHGAKPVLGGGGTKYAWIYQPQYGETNEEIADAVAKEWLAAGSPDCYPGGLWFALSSPYVGNRE